MYNISSIFYLKPTFFYFTLLFLQNIHISLSILQNISIKYYFSSIFLLFLLSTTFTYSLSLSLPFFQICCSLYTHQVQINTAKRIELLNLNISWQERCCKYECYMQESGCCWPLAIPLALEHEDATAPSAPW